MSRKIHQSEYRLNRPLVLDRDKNCCVKCGSALGLEVHHVEGYKNATVDAMATLCYLCHNIAPMGMEAFAQWILDGESGIESVERKILQNGGNGLAREAVWEILTALVALGLETNKLRMKAARDRIKKSGLRCEGQKYYGFFLDEKGVLERIKDLRMSGISCDKIAAILNTDKILSRKGGKWLGCTVNRILWREIPDTQRSLKISK